MPPKKICSDKAPLGKKEWSVSACFKRGRNVGVYIGKRLQKDADKKNFEKKRKQIEASAQAITLRNYKTISVEKATNDVRKTYLKELKVPNYRNMSMEQTIDELKRRGFKSLIIPRV